MLYQAQLENNTVYFSDEAESVDEVAIAEFLETDDALIHVWQIQNQAQSPTDKEKSEKNDVQETKLTKENDDIPKLTYLRCYNNQPQDSQGKETVHLLYNSHTQRYHLLISHKKILEVPLPDNTKLRIPEDIIERNVDDCFRILNTNKENFGKTLLELSGNHEVRDVLCDEITAQLIIHGTKTSWNKAISAKDVQDLILSIHEFGAFSNKKEFDIDFTKIQSSDLSYKYDFLLNKIKLIKNLIESLQQEKANINNNDISITPNINQTDNQNLYDKHKELSACFDKINIQCKTKEMYEAYVEYMTANDSQNIPGNKMISIYAQRQGIDLYIWRKQHAFESPGLNNHQLILAEHCTPESNQYKMHLLTLEDNKYFDISAYLEFITWQEMPEPVKNNELKKTALKFAEDGNLPLLKLMLFDGNHYSDERYKNYQVYDMYNVVPNSIVDEKIPGFLISQADKISGHKAGFLTPTTLATSFTWEKIQNELVENKSPFAQNCFKSMKDLLNNGRALPDNDMKCLLNNGKDGKTIRWKIISNKASNLCKERFLKKADDVFYSAFKSDFISIQKKVGDLNQATQPYDSLINKIKKQGEYLSEVDSISSREVTGEINRHKTAFENHNTYYENEENKIRQEFYRDIYNVSQQSFWQQTRYKNIKMIYNASTKKYSAANEISTQLFEQLFKTKISENLADEAGNTLLHIAVRNQDVLMIKFLLEQNADVNIKNNKGKTPIDLAKETEVLCFYTLLTEKNKTSADIQIVRANQMSYCPSYVFSEQTGIMISQAEQTSKNQVLKQAKELLQQVLNKWNLQVVLNCDKITSPDFAEHIPWESELTKLAIIPVGDAYQGFIIIDRRSFETQLYTMGNLGGQKIPGAKHIKGKFSKVKPNLLAMTKFPDNTGDKNDQKNKEKIRKALALFFNHIQCKKNDLIVDINDSKFNKYSCFLGYYSQSLKDYNNKARKCLKAFFELTYSVIQKELYESITDEIKKVIQQADYNENISMDKSAEMTINADKHQNLTKIIEEFLTDEKQSAFVGEAVSKIYGDFIKKNKTIFDLLRNIFGLEQQNYYQFLSDHPGLKEEIKNIINSINDTLLSDSKKSIKEILKTFKKEMKLHDADIGLKQTKITNKKSSLVQAYLAVIRIIQEREEACYQLLEDPEIKTIAQKSGLSPNEVITILIKNPISTGIDFSESVNNEPLSVNTPKTLLQIAFYNENTKGFDNLLSRGANPLDENGESDILKKICDAIPGLYALDKTERKNSAMLTFFEIVLNKIGNGNHSQINGQLMELKSYPATNTNIMFFGSEGFDKNARFKEECFNNAKNIFWEYGNIIMDRLKNMGWLKITYHRYEKFAGKRTRVLYDLFKHLYLFGLVKNKVNEARTRILDEGYYDFNQFILDQDRQGTKNENNPFFSFFLLSHFLLGLPGSKLFRLARGYMDNYGYFASAEYINKLKEKEPDLAKKLTGKKTLPTDEEMFEDFLKYKGINHKPQPTEKDIPKNTSEKSLLPVALLQDYKTVSKIYQQSPINKEQEFRLSRADRDKKIERLVKDNQDLVKDNQDLVKEKQDFKEKFEKGEKHTLTLEEKVKKLEKMLSQQNNNDNTEKNQQNGHSNKI